MLSRRHHPLKWQLNRTLPISSKSLISTAFEPTKVKNRSAPKVHCYQSRQSKKGRSIHGCIGKFTWDGIGDNWRAVSCENPQFRINQAGFAGTKDTFL